MVFQGQVEHQHSRVLVAVVVLVVEAGAEQLTVKSHVIFAEKVKEAEEAI